MARAVSCGERAHVFPAGEAFERRRCACGEWTAEGARGMVRADRAPRGMTSENRTRHRRAASAVPGENLRKHDRRG